MIKPQLRELLLQALEHERGGALVYFNALECTRNEDLRKEWEKYLDQTLGHVDILTAACAALGLDPDEMTPGCRIVQQNGKALIAAMRAALAEGNREAAELVACDCVVIAETKDHANWQLIGKCAAQMDGDAGRVLRAAYEQVEDQEDEHLYHSKGWCRELWLASLGLPAQLPPPKEVKNVRDAKAAAEVESRRV